MDPQDEWVYGWLETRQVSGWVHHLLGGRPGLKVLFKLGGVALLGLQFSLQPLTLALPFCQVSLQLLSSAGQLLMQVGHHLPLHSPPPTQRDLLF